MPMVTTATTMLTQNALKVLIHENALCAPSGSTISGGPDANSERIRYFERPCKRLEVLFNLISNPNLNLMLELSKPSHS